MNTAYKFRIYPNKEQMLKILRVFGCVRFIYNYYLQMRIDSYELANVSINYYGCNNDLTGIKKSFKWLKECDATALQNELMHLETAFKNFFEQRNVGYPKYKSKHKSKDSYTTTCINNNIRFEDNRIKLPKLGLVKVRKHRDIPNGYTIKSATVSRTASGKFYVSILFEHESQVKKIAPRKFIGLDYSSPYLYIDSDGNEPDYPMFFRQAEEKLAREQRKLSRMKFRSNNWFKQKRKVAVCHEKVANQRKDFLHKLSRTLADNYDVIGIEDLNMRAMSQSLNLGKSTMDNGWGMFTTFLNYKLERQGKQLVRIDKWFPSTKTCHECGCVKPMKLNERQYVCPECGMVFDRDWNAATNIREEAKRIVNSNNRGAHGDSSLILAGMPALNEKPPLLSAAKVVGACHGRRNMLNIGDNVYGFVDMGFQGGLFTYEVVEKRESRDSVQYVVSCENFNYKECLGDELILIGHKSGENKKKDIYQFVEQLTQDGYDEYGEYHPEDDYTRWHRDVTFFKTKREAYIDYVEKTIRRKEQYVTDAEKQLERAKSDLEDYKVKAQAVIDALNE